ncbi:MAG: hypothetical protein ACFCGT_02525 [Sandaracinaceae bacterium]
MRTTGRQLALASALGAVAFGAALWAVGLARPSEAACDDSALCQPLTTRLTPEGYLRAASLDLRGTIPTVTEYDGVESHEDVEARIDEWLADEAFARRVARRHRELLWPNIENQRQLITFRRALGTSRADGQSLWNLTTRRQRELYRGMAVPCLNEPATFDDMGRPVTRMVDGAAREGYVMVEPYWAPGTQIRVCAFDAQEAAVGLRGTDCAGGASVNDPGCGCGPNLQWCAPNGVELEILREFNRDVEERVVAHVLAGADGSRDEPYYELFTSTRGFVSGPLVHYWTHLTAVHQGITLEPVAMDVERLPDLDYTDRSMVPVELPEVHAGVLTTPVYLLRFQTNRARANRFYDAFLCEPFQPPEGGIAVEDEVAALQPDVQQRPGCNYCHAVLEPAAAHWGRWTQQGAGYLDPVAYPEYREECADCGRGLEVCSEDCRFNYITRALSPEEEPYLGALRAFEFLRDEHRPNVEAGPSALVMAGVADGRFTGCSVRRTVTWLFGREPLEREQELVAELTREFLDGEFSYRELVRAIVTHETYRRAL